MFDATLETSLAQQVQRLALTIDGLTDKFESLSRSAQQRHEPPDLLSAKQLARKLGISTRSVWRLLGRGLLLQPIRSSRKLVR